MGKAKFGKNTIEESIEVSIEEIGKPTEEEERVVSNANTSNMRYDPAAYKALKPVIIYDVPEMAKDKPVIAAVEAQVALGWKQIHVHADGGISSSGIVLQRENG